MTTDLLTLRPVAATTVTLTPGQLEQANVHDSELVDDTLERVHVTLGDHELVLESPDLLVTVDELRKILDEIEAGTLDERQAKVDAERHICWCNVRIDPDMVTCGAPECDRTEVLNREGRIP